MEKNEQELNQRVSEKYIRFNNAFMTFFRKYTNGRTPNRGQSKILSVLAVRPEITQKELIAKLDMTPPSATELLQKLETKKLIRREKSETDKRSYTIYLTEAGRHEFDQGQEHQPLVLNALTLEEKIQFDHILDKLLIEIEQKNH